MASGSSLTSTRIVISLPGAAIGLAFGLVNAKTGAADSAGLPVFAEALRGMLLGAGLLIAIDLLGSWVIRRFRERAFPEFPLGYQQIALSLLAGAWLGVWWGVGVGGLLVGVVLGTVRVIPPRRIV